MAPHHASRPFALAKPIASRHIICGYPPPDAQPMPKFGFDPEGDSPGSVSCPHYPHLGMVPDPIALNPPK